MAAGMKAGSLGERAPGELAMDWLACRCPPSVLIRRPWPAASATGTKAPTAARRALSRSSAYLFFVGLFFECVRW